ncbi:hypothetical protein NQZ79_g8441 [Umbelopsis isabellina]|nr:hypothetical protein NQZ79_g8441 [Umbelopsis isabellina]
MERRHTVHTDKRKTMVDKLAVFKSKGPLLDSTDPPLVLLKVISEEAGCLSTIKQNLSSKLHTTCKNIPLMNAWYELPIGGEDRNVLNFADRIELSMILAWIPYEDKVASSAARGFYLAFNRYSYQALWEVVLSDVKLKDKQDTISTWYQQGNLPSVLGSLTCTLLKLWFNDLGGYSHLVLKLYLLLFIKQCQGKEEDLLIDLSRELEVPEEVMELILLAENDEIEDGKLDEMADTVYRLFDDISILSHNTIKRSPRMFCEILGWLEKTARDGEHTYKPYNGFTLRASREESQILAELCPF